MDELRSDLDLMELHVRTLFVHDGGGRLVRTSEPPGNAPTPRFFLGRTALGDVSRVRHGLPDEIAARLRGLAASEPATAALRMAAAEVEEYVKALSVQAAVTSTYHGPAYYFPPYAESDQSTVCVAAGNKGLLRQNFPSLLAEVEARQPCAAVVEEGAAVSVCYSARITREAAEAGVETAQKYRGRGHATRAVTGWAAALRRRGLVPLYSTSWDNLASQAVARKLGLVLYGSDFHLT